MDEDVSAQDYYQSCDETVTADGYSKAFIKQLVLLVEL